MKKSIIPAMLVLLAIVAYSNTSMAETSARALIEQCRQQADSQGVKDVADYINACLDELVQYDTSE
jgi:hypothetical protein